MMKKRTVQFSMVLAAAALLAGGGGGESPLWGSLDALKAENTELKLRVQSLQAQNDQLNEQVDTLSGLDKNVRMKDLDTLDKIQIGRHTGLYDLDKNGTNEVLAVYVEPLDMTQDYIKAIGHIEVELWDLDAPAAKAKLADWSLAPKDIETLWGGTIFTSYYRLQFPVAGILSGQEKNLTVKVTFTDFLSGKILSDQTAISPQVP